MKFRHKENISVVEAAETLLLKVFGKDDRCGVSKQFFTKIVTRGRLNKKLAVTFQVIIPRGINE